ncbi:hypothetical protein, conserved [Trypanosoma brucei gambiense DAL972]|uniref:Importin N-terminal domain-containing protein n=1 Tax=Trypanosoma brucei gambiense (strain MHOM/CI/86/DAL972) TaxID=679716 RepID=C9ZS36_TRYB9|nr:hypothetical protein, conserved [Trypanosoma brucei gambiense DAL972]CBH12172.1 hypothetical protein, conserved [Trypanosoma brucei gambiense DAL972]|eukprot:XP_011774455.1 hypothetical protein, conserved [Trypanosoma brucei gambiense DAL972]
MDVVLEVLRTSNNNDERKKADAQLRQMQESDPQAFLMLTWDGISSTAVDTTTRFFLASTVVQFVEQSWQHSVPKDLQVVMINRYLHLLLCSEPLPSVTLARKVALLLGLMLKRCNARGEPGALPPPLEHAGKMIGESVVHAVNNLSPTLIGLATQYLLVLHVVLKEMEGKRVGGVFPRLCASLVPVMSSVFVSSATWDYVTCYMPLLYMMKCVLRVFGSGVFDAGFYPHLLDITWRLAHSVSVTGQPTERVERGQRLMEYAIKVQLKMLSVFPSKMDGLPPAFFISQGNGDMEDRSLLALLVAIIESPIGTVVTEKLVCRALLTFKALLTVEDSQPFVANCVIALANAPQLLSRVIDRITYFLADATGDAVLRAWDLSPEHHAAELERLIDDTEHVSSCAEELLLALTGSTHCSESSLRLTWEVANALLDRGGVEEVTAALHVIGICCYTMADGPYSASFMNFLAAKLLPIITAAATSTVGDQIYPSPFVLRRVVWVVGMWCESVKGSVARSEVHRALTSLLGAPTHVVLQLCALQAIGHFILDLNFSIEDVPAECVQGTLCAIQNLLPQLSAPATIEQLAGLVQGLIARKLLHVGSGELLLDMMLPAVYRAISGAQRTPDGEADHSGGNDDGDEESDDDVSLQGRCIGLLLECVHSCVTIAAPELEERVWSLFRAIVLPCTEPGSRLSLWADEQAWELLLSMCCAARSWLPETNDALLFCLDNMTREISSRHIVVRCVYSILLLCPEPAKHISVALVDHAMAELTQTCSSDVASAYFALLAVMLRRGEVTLRCHLLSLALHKFLSIKSVHSESFSEQLALLLAWGFLPYGDCENWEVILLDTVAKVLLHHPNANSFVEWIVLLFDVSPGPFVTEQLVRLLQHSLSAQHTVLLQLIGEDDRVMARKAVEGTLLPPSSMQERGADTDEVGELVRDPTEMLMELFGDTALIGASPHVIRLCRLFDVCAIS